MNEVGTGPRWAMTSAVEPRRRGLIHARIVALVVMGVLVLGLAYLRFVGLGLYFAWVSRDWSAKTKAAGFGAAMSGALVGAWFGFNVTAGLLALVTTIVGAGVGANLTMIVRDISWDRSGS